MEGLSDRTKKIDLRSKLIVNGFIRESQKLLPFEENVYYNLNELIIQICLIYYAINEYWDLISSDFITNKDKSELKRQVGGNWNNTNYGKTIIPSIGNFIYEWYLKIGSLEYGYAFIGICDSKYNVLEDSAEWAVIPRYLWDGNTGFMEDGKAASKSVEGLKYMTGDIISIRLNTKEGTVEFYKALEDKEKKLSGQMDVEQGQDLSYRLAATIYWHGNYITLTQFDVARA